VAGVGKQRQTVGLDACDYLNSHECEGRHLGPPEDAAGRGAVRVRVRM
jgi:hypothetical protein